MVLIIVFAASLVALVLFLLFLRIENTRGKRFFEETREKTDTVTVAVARHISEEFPKTGRALIKSANAHAKTEVKRHSNKIHETIKQQAKKISEHVRANGSSNGKDNKQASAFIRDITAHKQKLREQRNSPLTDKKEV